MKVGVALNMLHEPGRPDVAVVTEHLAMGDLAEPLGFDSLWALEHHFTGYGQVSATLNLLTLSGSFFMLLVYDTVLPAHSMATLVGLGLILAVLYTFQGLLDYLRMRVLGQIGAAVDADVSGEVFDTLGRMALTGPAQGDGLQPVRDLDQVRNFLSGQGPMALIDLPWMVVFLAICFAFHALISGENGRSILLSITLPATLLAWMYLPSPT